MPHPGPAGCPSEGHVFVGNFTTLDVIDVLTSTDGTGFFPSGIASIEQGSFTEGECWDELPAVHIGAAEFDGFSPEWQYAPAADRSYQLVLMDDRMITVDDDDTLIYYGGL